MQKEANNYEDQKNAIAGGSWHKQHNGMWKQRREIIRKKIAISMQILQSYIHISIGIWYWSVGCTKPNGEAMVKSFEKAGTPACTSPGPHPENACPDQWCRVNLFAAFCLLKWDVIDSVFEAWYWVVMWFAVFVKLGIIFIMCLQRCLGFSCFFTMCLKLSIGFSFLEYSFSKY